MTHDLWDGTVGFDTTKFSPFLTSVSTSFSVTPATLQGLASLVGLRRRRAPSAAAPPPGPQQGGGGQAGGGGGIGLTGFQGQGALPTGGPRAGGAGRAFSLGARYSSTRTRPKAGTQAVADQGGLQQLSMDLRFAPTRHWSASWSSVYDVDTRQFGQHALSLERDLNRWHASFSFLKSPTGSFAFSFYIALLDQPDIKFDYQQQTLTR
jgi:hypothetical protein